MKKKHHYVPQSILKRFSVAGKGKQIFVFNKHEEKSYPNSILNSGSENKCNTISTPFDELKMEWLYQEIDNIDPVTTKKL